MTSLLSLPHNNPTDISIAYHQRQKLYSPDLRPPKQSDELRASQLARRLLYYTFQSPGLRFNQICRMSSIQQELRVKKAEPALGNRIQG